MAHRGFTLTEAMVVVILLGVLVAVGIPSYTRTIERNYRQHAEDVLMSIYYGERSYSHTQNSYYGPPLNAASPMAEWRKIQMDNPNLGSVNVSFSVAAAGSTFTATATRTSGTCSGRTRTITQTRTLGGDWPTCAP
mgnify:FL=1